MIQSLLFLSLLLSFQLHALNSSKWTRDIVTSSFDWTAITPTEDLVFHKCDILLDEMGPLQKTHKQLQCARLSLPLDWRNESGPLKVAIAIVRFPSGLNASDPTYGGSLLTNPGGPGIPGISHIIETDGYHKILDGGKKQFDVVSFDPRGIQFSTPAAQCFSGPPGELFWTWRGLDADRLDVSLEERRLFWIAERERLSNCADQRKGAPTRSDIFNFMGTKSVARDMLAIVQKLDLINKPLENFVGNLTSRDSPQFDSIQQSNTKLQYLGLSYGTALGNLFATMFPDHVGRMVLDGNVDAIEFFDSGMESILVDADAAYDFFLESCFNRPSSCSLAKDGDRGPQDIKARIDYAISSHKTAFDRNSSAADVELRTTVAHKIRTRIIESIRSPYTLSTGLAESLSLLMDVELWNNSPSNGSQQPANTTPTYDWLQDVKLSVTCSDRAKTADGDYEAFERYYKSLESQSPTFAWIWAAEDASCRLWPESLQAQDRYQGPLGTGNSTMPILFLNTKFDPVCPLRNAHRMSSVYPGSVVLESNATGHCATFQPSSCVRRHLRDYLDDSTLPEPGTVCNDTGNPFDAVDPSLLMP
ncbi:MAG: hypothetical protein Q9160_001283 [Pyrenula sp. 1 TL-2023]